MSCLFTFRKVGSGFSPRAAAVRTGAVWMGMVAAGVSMLASCAGSPPATERVSMPEPEPKCTSNKDCDPGFYCETSVGECLSAVLERCEYRPLSDGFRIREEWAWTQDAEVLPEHDQIMASPMVANLTDDDGDGKIDQNDVPDVVFNTFKEANYQTDGVLRAVSGDSGARIWPVGDPGYRTAPGTIPAIADVSPDSPGPEVITCEVSTDANGRQINTILILKSDGTPLHRFREAPNLAGCIGRPSVGDMDGDGTPEIVDGVIILHGDGTLVRKLDIPTTNSILVSIDDDDDLEIITPRGAYNYDGSPVWEAAPGVGPANGLLAVADIDADYANPKPEIIVMETQKHSLWVLDGATGAVRWGGNDINPAGAVAMGTNGLRGGGPPLIANFDDDPFPEIGVAGGFAYAVFGHDGVRQWDRPTDDLSSRATGSSVFDFEGDGIAEVLYNDEQNFHVYRGVDGEELLTQCNTSGTLVEFPIVVDVDNDARAEVVLMENNYAFQMCLDGVTPSSTGIHVYGHPDGEWVGSRRIYNQFSYHITNINDDGTVPKREEPHWRLPLTNSFRKNVALFDVPDLIAEDMAVGDGTCPEFLELSVNIINRGAAVSAPNVPISFFSVGEDGSKTFVGQSFTSKRLKSADFERVTFAYPVTAEQLDQTLRFTASINHPDHEPLTEMRECHTDNNDSDAAENDCHALF